jgi:ABC-type antimicrobial peptide transport system permease subunit
MTDVVLDWLARGLSNPEICERPVIVNALPLLFPQFSWLGDLPLIAAGGNRWAP